MAVKATLERGPRNITLPLIEEGAGVPIIAEDIGFPESGASSKGVLNPRWSDFQSRSITVTINAQVVENAYSTAIELANFIKSNANGTNTTISFTGLDEYPDPITVAPAPIDSALSIAYPPGQRNWVDVQLQLVEVSETIGGGQDDAQTPTATGTGPLTLSDGTNTLEIRTNVSVERDIGRPHTSISGRPQTDLPVHVEKIKMSYDAFSLSFELVDNAAAKKAALMDMIRQPLGRRSLTLDFNGLFGLGSFSVVPFTSQGIRFVRPSAEKGTIIVPNLDLRVVFQ